MDTTSTTSTPLVPPSIDELRSLFERATLIAAQVADAITPEQYDRATGLDMNVAELAEHIVMAVRRAACAARGLPFDQWPVEAGDMALGDPGDALRSAAADVVEAWDGVSHDRPMALPWGEFPAHNVLGVYINEVVVHTWDLARATGQSPAWDDELVAAASEAIHQQLPDADRTAMWAGFAEQIPEGVPWEAPFANAIEVDADASSIDRLVAWNGRTP